MQGDSRELAKSIPDESIDLIFTDPVYENIDDYAWLAETAQRVLKPNSSCLVFCANRKLYKVQQAMIPPLEYVKVISYQVIKMINGVYQNHFDDKTMVMWTPLLYLEKGISRPSKRTWDYAFTQFGNGDNHHKWSKAVKPFNHWLQGFTFGRKNPIVYDPFFGGGTTGVSCKMLGIDFIASEANQETWANANQRLLQTQPALVISEAQQGVQRTANAASQQASFITDGDLPSKARGATRRR